MQLRENPYKSIRPKKPQFPMYIYPEVWINHFTGLLQTKEARPAVHEKEEWEPSKPFTTKEIETAVSASKNGKAHGPDKVYYEHLKQSLPTIK